MDSLKKFTGNPPYRLHLGCGAAYLPGHINIDIRMPSTGKLDLQADVRKLPFKPNSCKEIISFHLFEHLSHRDAQKALCHWFRLLQNNGKLIMELPDFDAAVHGYLLGNEEFLKNVFGNQINQYQVHYWGYNFHRLKKELEEVGFKQVVRKKAVDYHTESEPCFRIEAVKLARSNFHLEVTNVCTRSGKRCRYCADSDTRKTGYINLDLADKILKQIGELNSERKVIFLFLSGEPLLHPEIGEIIRMAGVVGKTIIHTNADVLTEEKALEIINSGLSEICFTLHEMSDTGEVSAKAVENIKRFLKINDHQVRSKVQRIIPFPEEMPSEKDVMREFRGVDVVHFRRPHNWVRDGSIDGAKRIEDKPPFTCGFLHSNIAIAWDGRVFVCCGDLNGEWTIGDLKKEDLKEIDIRLDVILERQINGEDIPELCSQCERYKKI